MKNTLLTVFLLAFAALATAQSEKNPNFYIYLCFGQSNMEGAARPEAQDSLNIDSRFRVMATLDCPNREREKGNWYTAVPPLCRCYTGLGPADYFGRTMVANLPDIGRALCQTNAGDYA